MSKKAQPVVHVVKLAVGVDSVESLVAWQKHQIAHAKKHKLRPNPVCGTRAWPKRAEEILAGGSLYWVIKGVVLVRQRIIAIDDVTDEHGPRCGLFLDPDLVRTAPQPRSAFQGWRYLEAKDAPSDLAALGGGDDLPEDFRRQLAELGAW